MATLRQILKKRAMAAVPAQQQEMPLHTALPKELLKPIQAGHVPAGQVGSMLDTMASRITSMAVRHRQVKPGEADMFRSHVYDYLRQYQKPLEAEAYKSFSPLQAPTSPGQTALLAGESVALPYAIGKGTEVGGKLWSKMRGIPHVAVPAAEAMTLGKALNWGLGPASFLPMALMGGVSTALQPLGDPLYRRGERGYLKSVGESVRAEASELARKGEEVRRKHGLLGVPIQLFHGVTHPLASLYMGGQSIKNLLSTKQGEDLALHASEKVAEALSEKQCIDIAWKMPPELVKWCAVRLGAHATQGPWSDQIVSRLTFLDALQRWPEKSAAQKKIERIPLSADERAQVKAKFGPEPGCSFCRDKKGIYCHTHRARSDSYKSVAAIPQSVVDFIESTG